MRKTYKGIKAYDKLEMSPFIDTLYEMEVSARRRILAGKDRGAMMINPDGEVEAHQVFAIQEKVDPQTFTKMFSGMIKELFQLSPRGVRVFGYITSICKPNKDVVMFDMEEALVFTKYKKEQSILHGLEELLQHDIIARTKKHYKYFINPNLFFNGSRLTLIRHYQKDGRLKAPLGEEMKILPPSEK
jgi:hypothetical protein